MPRSARLVDDAGGNIMSIVSGGTASVTLGTLSHVYDGTAKVATAVTVPVGKAVSFTYNGSAIAPADAGTYTVVATVNDSNYHGSASGTMTIEKAVQGITFNPLSPKTYGDAPITLTATGGASGTPVSFSIISGPGSLSDTGNSTLTITGAGTIEIAANQAGTTNYTAAAPVNRSLVVGKATATVTLSNLSQTYDTTAKTATVTTIPGGLSVITTYDNASTAPSATGSYSVTATVNDSNYQGTAGGTLIINPAPKTLTVTVSGAGTGTVTSTPAGISCTGSSCTGSFTGTVNLYATPSLLSKFGGWQDACTGLGTCSVTLTADRNVTASFGPATLLHISGTAYGSLQDAYKAATEGDIMQLLQTPTTPLGTFTADRSITVKLRGGYDSAYAATPGMTTVTAPVTLKQGKVIMDRIVVR